MDKEKLHFLFTSMMFPMGLVEKLTLKKLIELLKGKRDKNLFFGII